MRAKLMQKILFVALGAAVLGGCATTDPYTGERKASNTAKGAGIGALAGAAIGALTGDNSKERRKHALIGAGAGALAGGAVGQYMDRQEAKLRAQLQGTGVSVTRSGDSLTLNMPGNITFRTGSADLASDFYGVLDSVGLVLKEYDKTLIDVAGHTDSAGAEEMNQSLSERRANAVAEYLRTRGVSMSRVATIGFGEMRPLRRNDTPEGRAQNRRVELTLTPITAS